MYKSVIFSILIVLVVDFTVYGMDVEKLQHRIDQNGGKWTATETELSQLSLVAGISASIVLTA